MNILNRGIAVLLIAVLTLIGCGGGGGGGGGTTTVTGKFIDATVVGMSYKCGTSTTVSGTTTATGEFTCPAGQAVAFYVGDILIGSVASATTVVTPLDLVGTGATPANVQVANIVRFLMSLSTTLPSSGTITLDPAAITAAAGKTINFATATTALDTLITTIRPSATVYTSAQAAAHVTASINGLFAGNYSGTYSGTASGTWSVTVDANGAVTGSIDGVAGAITGNMATALSTGSTYGFTGTGNTYPWAGTLNVSTKTFSGTWGTAPTNGMFTGTTSTSTGGGATTTPTVTGFSPATGAVGTTVTITGTNLGLGFPPAPIVKFGTTTVITPLTFSGQTSVSFAVPAGLAAGTYPITIGGATGTPMTVGTFTVTAAGGGVTGGAGLKLSPAFNGLSTFANQVPYHNGGGTLVYSQGVGIPNVTISYVASVGTGSENITVSIMPDLSGAQAFINQGTSFASPMCILTAVAGVSAPVCSTVGVTFNKATGNVSFVNTPMQIGSSGTTTAFTLNGSLTFTPF